MKTVKKCIVIVAILILTFAIFGKFLNQNIATPFFKRTLSNSSNIVLEVLCLVLACLIAYIENLYQNQAASRETVDKAMKKCISERITSRSVLENLKFHFRKFAFSWSDPTNYSVHNLGLISGDGDQTSVETDVWKIDGVKSLTKNNLYLEQGPLAIIHYIYLNVYQNVIYLTVMLLLLRHVFKNTQFQAGSFVIFVTMIGTAAFHLIWEARSRYLILICLLLLIFIFTNITDRKVADEEGKD